MASAAAPTLAPTQRAPFDLAITECSEAAKSVWKLVVFISVHAVALDWEQFLMILCGAFSQNIRYLDVGKNDNFLTIRLVLAL